MVTYRPLRFLRSNRIMKLGSVLAAAERREWGNSSLHTRIAASRTVKSNFAADQSGHAGHCECGTLVCSVAAL